MMDRKPWDNRDSHREGFGGRREWNSDRRFGDDRPRFNRDRDDRFGSDRPRFNRDDRFGDDRSDRRFGGDRPRFNRDRDDRFGGDRPRFGGNNRYSSKTGPRARAFNESRYQQNDDYSKRQIIKIDAEVAAFFPTAKDVNDALRLVIALTRKVKDRAAEAAAEKAEEAVADEAVEMNDDEVAVEDEEGEDEAFEETEATVSEDKAE